MNNRIPQNVRIFLTSWEVSTSQPGLCSVELVIHFRSISQDSSVCIVSRPKAGWSGAQFPAGKEILSSPKSPTCSGAHPVSNSIVTGGSFFWGKVSGVGVKLRTHFHLEPPYTTTPPCADRHSITCTCTMTVTVCDSYCELHMVLLVRQPATWTLATVWWTCGRRRQLWQGHWIALALAIQLLLPTTLHPTAG